MEDSDTLYRAIDRVQKRYKWTDEYIVEMPYSRLLQLMVDTALWETEKSREEYRKQAFLTWRIEGMFATETIPTFEEYCNEFGFGDVQVENETEITSSQEALDYIDELFNCAPLKDREEDGIVK
ncbi:hypothetical protein JFL43_10625 [Viridibacillus sp. YIM B01967]|uniref:Uncharacterized protein n=1 Tax=Viridibacillus soli TaxID=2798301 RepID=A0ABS1H861_9BACL|nr:hypothetical protein [Viridibacillus soli]MBK3495297.1 hypothetical protein [Viridibacillus soli]